MPHVFLFMCSMCLHFARVVFALSAPDSVCLMLNHSNLKTPAPGYVGAHTFHEPVQIRQGAVRFSLEQRHKVTEGN